MPQDDSRYSKPELRERIKDRIMAGDRGAKKGQWSARKSQLLAQEYEKAAISAFSRRRNCEKFACAQPLPGNKSAIMDICSEECP